MSASLFSAKVAELIKQSASLSLDARKKILEMLDAVSKEIAARLALMSPSASKLQLQVLKGQIDQLFQRFQQQATKLIDDYEAQSFALGSKIVVQPIITLGSQGFGQISTSALAIAQGYTADLVKGLSVDAAAKVNAAIQRAFLGGQQITDIIAQVGKAIGGEKGFTGLFNAIGRRASTITLNEILRVQSIAAQARLEDAFTRHPDLQKQWRHLNLARVPRPGHIAAHLQIVNVKKPFIVEGEELMYPRDPNGSAENTINCHCMMAPYFAPEALKPTPGQKGLLDSLGISVSAA
jgi:hypothetical protein